jgi:ribosome modulation factor
MQIDRCIQRLADDPKGDIVHQPFTAFNQGHDAFHWGLKRDANPYPTSSEKASWDDGWSTAMYDMLDKADKS